ncbi:MAG: ACP S-malonyltransferase [Fibrobacterota bacterium]
MMYFLFPGQGSQTVGMGRDLYEKDATARARFDEACDVLGFDIKKICFEGPEEALKATENTQPALFLAGYVIFEAISRHGLKAGVCAGHSLGEYTAIAAAGGFDFAAGLRLVRKRGELMAKAKSGAMAAVLAFDAGKLEAICRECSVDGEVVVPANYNSPDQIVISGSVKGVNAAMEKIKAAGAKRVLLLPVSGAFHSPLMKDAAEEMKAVLAQAPIRDTAIPVISNVTAQPVSRGAEIRDLLYRQLFSPVRWTDSFKAAAPGSAVEMGPGKVLAGLLKKINPAVNVLPAQNLDDIRQTLQTLGVSA